MNKKFIDAERCREDFVSLIYDILCDERDNLNANAIVDAFDDLPSADVQEVVRCKDCKYLKVDTLDQKTVYYCTQNVFAKRRVKLDDFCSYGTRMDGEEKK